MADIKNVVLTTVKSTNGSFTEVEKINLNKQSTVLSVILDFNIKRNCMNTGSSVTVHPTVNFYDKDNNLLDSVSYSFTWNKSNDKTSDGRKQFQENFNNINLEKVKYIELSSKYYINSAGGPSQTITCTVNYEEAKASEKIKSSVKDVILNHKLIKEHVAIQDKEK
jgi:hypothetical protein